MLVVEQVKSAHGVRKGIVVVVKSQFGSTVCRGRMLVSSLASDNVQLGISAIAAVGILKVAGSE